MAACPKEWNEKCSFDLETTDKSTYKQNKEKEKEQIQ